MTAGRSGSDLERTPPLSALAWTVLCSDCGWVSPDKHASPTAVRLARIHVRFYPGHTVQLSARIIRHVFGRASVQGARAVSA